MTTSHRSLQEFRGDGYEKGRPVVVPNSLARRVRNDRHAVVVPGIDSDNDVEDVWCSDRTEGYNTSACSYSLAMETINRGLVLDR